MNIILFEKDEISRALPLSDKRAQHITGILRLSAGGSFHAGIVNGKSGTAVIRKIDENGLFLSFDLKKDSDFLFPLTLIIGLPRPPVTRRLLKDLTTIGVEKIIFTAAENTEKSYLSGHLWKEDCYRQFLIDGAQQGFATAIPAVERCYSLKKALTLPSGNPARIVLSPGGKELSSELQPLLNRACVLAVGPERGWSDNEAELFAVNGYTAVCLNERILRTETACILGAGLVLEKMGFIRSPK